MIDYIKFYCIFLNNISSVEIPRVKFEVLRDSMKNFSTTYKLASDFHFRLDRFYSIN